MKAYMLRMFSLVVLGIITTLFATCDKIDELDDVDFDAPLEGSINVNAPSAGTNVPYSDVIILDAMTDPDINEYASKIKSFTINSIRYQIISYDGPADALFSGTIAFGEAFQSTASVFATIDNFDLQQAYTTGQIFDLTFSPADITTIQNFLLNDKAVNIYLDGSLSETPLYCTIKIYLDVTVKADAL